MSKGGKSISARGIAKPRKVAFQCENDDSSSKQSDRAYTIIRNLIMRMELRPGVLLNERNLVERLSLGRTPIREALLRLASERLVVIGSSRGISVAPISFEEVSDIYEVRLQEDRLAARLCLESADDAAIERICGSFSSAGALVKAERFDDVFELDFRFHRMIYDAASNPFLSCQHDVLRGHYYRLAWLAASRRPHMRTKAGMMELVRSHDAMIAALRKRSHDKLDTCVVEHVSRSFNRVVSILSQSHFAQASELKMIGLTQPRPVTMGSGNSN